MKSIPLFIRKFIVDAVETFLGALFALNLAIPGDVDQAKAAALAAGAAAIAALVSAARRAVPGALAALKSFLYVEDEA